MAVSLYVAVALCGLVAALLVYRYDLYEREPWYLLVLAAGLGFAAMRIVDVLERATLRLVTGDWAFAGVAALEEEAVRLAVVVALAVALPRQLNDPMDGIVYGSIVGLGMGIEESFHYLSLLVQPDGLNGLGLPVELVRLLGHLILGGFVGYGVGLFAAGLPGWRRAVAGTVTLAVAVHFAWDVLALGAGAGAGAGERVLAMGPWRTAGAVALMAFGVIVYGVLVVAASARSKEMFAPRSRDSLWGWPFRRG